MLLQHDGFDHYGTATLVTQTTGTSGQFFTSAGYEIPTYSCIPNTYYGKNNGSLGIGLYTATSAYTWIKRKIGPESFVGTTFPYSDSITYLCLGFSMRVPANPTGNLKFLTVGGQTLSLGSDWFIYVNGTVTSYQWELNIWNFVEVEFDVTNSKCTVYMNDNVVAEVDLSGTTYVLDYWHVGAQYTTGGTSNQIIHFDDFYLLDGTGSYNNSRIGKCSTLTRYPTSDVDVHMVPSTGTSNYTMVDETPADSDTTYVKASTPGTYDLYGNTATFTTVDDAAVRAVSVSVAARMLEPDSISVTGKVKSGTATLEGWRPTLKAAKYTISRHIFEYDPNTNAQWVPDDVVNMSFGSQILDRETTGS